MSNIVLLHEVPDFVGSRMLEACATSTTTSFVNITVHRHRPRQRSQGEVKFLTGGNLSLWPAMARARERLYDFMFCRVSRSGEMPEPTVTVRMKETQPLEPGLL